MSKTKLAIELSHAVNNAANAEVTNPKAIRNMIHVFRENPDLWAEFRKQVEGKADE